MTDGHGHSASGKSGANEGGPQLPTDPAGGDSAVAAAAEQPDPASSGVGHPDQQALTENDTVNTEVNPGSSAGAALAANKPVGQAEPAQQHGQGSVAVMGPNAEPMRADAQLTTETADILQQVRIELDMNQAVADKQPQEPLAGHVALVANSSHVAVSTAITTGRPAAAADDGPLQGLIPPGAPLPPSRGGVTSQSLPAQSLKRLLSLEASHFSYLADYYATDATELMASKYSILLACMAAPRCLGCLGALGVERYLASHSCHEPASAPSASCFCDAHYA